MNRDLMNRDVMTRILVTALALALPALAPAQTVAPPTAQVGIHPSADSVRPYLVFAPRRETWFVAASRGKRMLLDIGRVDVEVRKDSAVAQAYRAAVAAASPVPIGTTFTLRGPWGTEQVRTTGVDTWNGRIVMVLSGSPAMDSAAQQTAVVVASAFRTTTTPGAAAGAAPCVRTPLAGPLAARVKVLRDSIEQVLRAGGLPPYERLAKRVTASSSQVVGCFGNARVALAVSLRAGANEWVRERTVLVDALGQARVVAVEDLRFKVHDLMHALDADGDGMDDLAAVGRTYLAGGTTLLRYDERKQKFVRLSTGFAWENR